MATDVLKMGQKRANCSAEAASARQGYAWRHIVDAVVSIALEGRLKSANVTDICKKAGVARSTFYRNFDDVEDVLKREFDRIGRDFVSSIDKRNPADAREFARLFIEHGKQHRDFYLAMSRAGLGFLVVENLDRYVSSISKATSGIERYGSAFVSWGTYGWIRLWLEEGAKEEVEELLDFFVDRTSS